MQPQAAEAAATVRALVLTGYGLNCDYETDYALRAAGASPERVHINDLIAGRARLKDFQIMVFIGGFAWADDHGAGVVLATKLRHHLGAELQAYVAGGGLVIGICNGFQALVNLGLLPGFAPGDFRREVALTYNDCGNFRDQWVHLAVADSPCLFTRGIARIELPVRHAEGKFAAAADRLTRLEREGLIALRYARPDGSPAGGEFPWNPNGSLDDIAGICDPTGRVFGLMPHAEAFCHATNHPDWTRTVRRAPRDARAGMAHGRGAGLRIFENGVAAARAIARG